MFSETIFFFIRERCRDAEGWGKKNGGEDAEGIWIVSLQSKQGM